MVVCKPEEHGASGFYSPSFISISEHPDRDIFLEVAGPDLRKVGMRRELKDPLAHGESLFLPCS